MYILKIFIWRYVFSTYTMYVHNIHTYLEIFSIYYEVHSIIIVDGLKNFIVKHFLDHLKNQLMLSWDVYIKKHFIRCNSYTIHIYIYRFILQKIDILCRFISIMHLKNIINLPCVLKFFKDMIYLCRYFQFLNILTIEIVRKTST